jgi:hypothetical protein
MSRRSVLVLVFLCVAIYGVGLAGYANAGGPADNPRCVGLKGAAYGMCVAAFATGCDDPATTKPGCATIEKKFTELTGETPPWTLPPCSCGTSDEFITKLDRQGGAVSCTDQVNIMLSIDSSTVSKSVFSNYPGNGPYQQCCLKSDEGEICILAPSSDDNLRSCIIELRATIDHYDLTCTVTPGKGI